MLNKEGFDLWADGYDKSVGLSDEQNTYPFAGYRRLMSDVYGRIMARGARHVLDIGFGTGVLAARLYQQGIAISGQDFSPRMIALAKDKMPDAHLVAGDFSQGLDASLAGTRYDAIIATYALHHLMDAQKVDFIRSLLPLLNDGGALLIGDVAFATRAQHDACRDDCGDEWDPDEIYFVFEELREHFPDAAFTKHSDCAGIIEIRA